MPPYETPNENDKKIVKDIWEGTTPNNSTDLKEKLEALKCVNGAIYFGSVEHPCSGRETGECCHNEQTFEEATAELIAFIQERESLAYERGMVAQQQDDDVRYLYGRHRREEEERQDRLDRTSFTQEEKQVMKLLLLYIASMVLVTFVVCWYLFLR